MRTARLILIGVVALVLSLIFGRAFVEHLSAELVAALLIGALEPINQYLDARAERREENKRREQNKRRPPEAG